MDETTNQPTQQYQTLGKKVLWLFFLQTSPIAFILLFASIILFVVSFQPFIINSFFGNMQKPVLLITLSAFVISLLVISGSLIFAWLNYKNYKFALMDDSFKIKRGFFNKTENAIPYRQIQNVDIERNFTFQMMGLSRLIILTAGHEDEKPEAKDEAEGVIQAIDQKIASWLQTELLKRAEVQKVVQENGTPGKN
jgi:putative membrane protein